MTMFEAAYMQSSIWVGVTVLSYLLAIYVFKRLNCSLYFHPIIVGALLVLGVCLLAGIPLEDYGRHSSPIKWLLGPITVALAVPLYQQLSSLIDVGWKGFFTVLCGALLAPLCALLVMQLGNFSAQVQISTLTKSITTPLAMDTSEAIGGSPELSTAIVVFTGLIGVLFSKIVFRLVKCQDPRVKGVALGTISHAIGTAHAFQLNDKIGAYSTMALCVNGVLTAVILPLLFYFFGT